MTHSRFILPNGLRVISVPMAGLESATVMVLVGAGSRYETHTTSGISHFLEHMAFKGTQSRPTSLDIAGIIDNVGGEFNAFTGKEVTGFYIKAHKSHVDLGLEVLADMLQHSLFDSAEMEKEKGVIIEEINMYEDSPTDSLGDLYEALLYGDSPMGWNTAGFKDVIERADRNDILDYMAKFYSSDNITLVVAGGITSEKIQVLVESLLSGMKRFDIKEVKSVNDHQTKPAVKVKSQRTEQIHIALGVRTVGLDHPDRYALDVLGTILGEGMSSRMFAEVREKRGLAYSIRTSSESYTDCGTLVTSAGVDKKRADEAIRVIWEQMKLVAENGVSETELKNAQEMIKGQLALELEDSRAVASFYAHQEILEKEILSPKEVGRKTDEVTIADVARVAKKYIVPETLNLAVIGNFSDEEEAAKRFESLLQ